MSFYCNGGEFFVSEKELMDSLLCFILTAHLDPSLCRVPYLDCLLLLPHPHRALA